MLLADMYMRSGHRRLEQMPERLRAVGREARSSLMIGPSPLLANDRPRRENIRHP